LLARAYFQGGPLGTSIQFRDDLEMLRYSPGRIVRQGVVAQHLAFAEGPLRASTVRRATMPTTHSRIRNARPLRGPHAEPEPDVARLQATVGRDGAPMRGMVTPDWRQTGVMGRS
jgi:hypothetical protein